VALCFCSSTVSPVDEIIPANLDFTRGDMLKERFHSWWQKIRQRRVAIAVTIAIIAVAIALIIVGYWFDVTGFNGYTQVSTIHTLSGPTAGTVTRTEMYQPGKTLWDWLQLLIIPVVLAAGGYLFNFTVSRNESQAATDRDKTERDITSDNQREEALQSYIDKISELLLEKQLRESQAEDEVRTIARVRTLTTLPRLDPKRKGSVLLFLAESGLIGDHPTIDLNRADLSGVQLYKPWLSEANLQETDLSKADLYEAYLLGANLSKADLYEAHLAWAVLHAVKLREANLIGADLHGAELGEADLREADLTEANLLSANLENANLRNAILRSANLSEALQLHFFGKTSP
jgi:uncharacterized protein YjbI with pentapeptide repeats